MKLPAVLITAVLITASLAANVVVEKRSAPPSSWKRSSTIPLRDDYIIPLRIGLRQSNLERLDTELRAVSHPSSAQYGQHWSAREIAKFFQPSEETVSAVQTWLSDAGFEAHRQRLTGGNSWMTINVTVNEAEALLDTRYEMYEHRSGALRPATHAYSVPSHIYHHIDIITPTLHFDHHEGQHDARLAKRVAEGILPGSALSGNGPKVSPLGFTGGYDAIAAAGQLGNCHNLTTLLCLEKLYNYAGYKQQATMLNSIGIVEYTPQSYAPQDLDMFFAQYSPENVGKRPDTHTMIGGFVVPVPTSSMFNPESDLDLEYSMPIVFPLVPTLYQIGVDGSFNTFLDGLDASYCTYEGGDDIAQGDIPYGSIPGQCGSLPYSAVISTSYGSDEVGGSAAYEQRQCYEYGKLGMQGTTFLYSSGDYGVAGNGGSCYDKTSGQTSATGTTFTPSFPGGCPYITSVGATETKADADVANDPYNAEIACESIIYSGGGFSNVFALPDFQKSAVATYFKEHLPVYTSAQYNNSQTTRGFPDIALNGARYPISYSGMNGLVYGTSASSPVGAALFTLINDARYAAGKGPIGYINNAIYTDEFAGGFNDITSGGNQGCGTPGFSAVEGWDPVTGLGTPNFQKLKELFLALP